MILNFRSCLFWSCPPLLASLMVPFFDHVPTLPLAFPVLFWLQSYISDRTQTVSTNAFKSFPAVIQCAVSQGSVLRVISITYFQPLSAVVSHLAFFFICFSDDILCLSPSLWVREIFRSNLIIIIMRRRRRRRQKKKRKKNRKKERKTEIGCRCHTC